MTITEEKLKNCFDEMVVYKDLKKQSNVFSTLSLPSFMRDWILRKFEDENALSMWIGSQNLYIPIFLKRRLEFNKKSCGHRTGDCKISSQNIYRHRYKDRKSFILTARFRTCV